ncbi:ATP-binding cassette domain-containing protein [Streptomyces sp. 3MP-14]|uniref:ATP-binding cassette domain-containing protein n=1 Tax=Streptomyces mimosae TaxID=2586635 RepID=A0A5N6A1Y1_9ACTN|nr:MULTISPECIES: ATP-binding cassette domain-containing protein [Streptomyces]KAB8162252.1 ATP-binding cassette domain-containing protein [Streptomyces mimosae]KAB8173849.1 ATP-binding cassette domain-containing protein [Streptomyces sp. 3MP-14]
MIEVTELTKRFRGAAAVDGLSFTVRPGRVTGFLGPNGAGKSTTLRLLLGLNRPTSGSATIEGRLFAGRPRGLRHVGALLDAHDVHGGRTARAHLTALALSNGLPRSRVPAVLEEVGLASAAGRRIGGFSLGMRQRLGIAGALLGDPPVLLFDEPVNGLDPEGVRWARGLFGRLAAEGRTVLVSSHLMSEMEHTAEELVVIGRGRLIAAEALATFASRATRQRVRVRSPQARQLAGLLAKEDGAGVVPPPASDPEAIEVTGLPAARIGDLAAHHRIPVHELSGRGSSLEDAFMELVADSVEYAAKDPR